MKRALKAATSGSVVIALLVGGCTAGTPGADPTASQAPSSVATPTASPSPSESVRTHVLSEASDGAVGVTVTVPASGWSGDHGGWAMEHVPDGSAVIIAYVVDEEFYVYGDPCDWKSTRPETPATTVNAIVRALADQASRDPSAPERITVDGYPGKKITLHVPDDVRFDEGGDGWSSFVGCDQDKFATFGVAGEEPALYAQGPGQTDEIWVVDVDGRIVLIEGGYLPQTSSDVVDELHDILSSATFEE